MSGNKSDVAVCFESVCEFFDNYDYHSPEGWLTEILNGNIHLTIMRKAILHHAEGNFKSCQVLVDEMHKHNWYQDE
tara:strand:- start:1577 stop:1804 length:228 start_codon:yes stop_codon:yes gene_type:complete